MNSRDINPRGTRNGYFGMPNNRSPPFPQARAVITADVDNRYIDQALAAIKSGETAYPGVTNDNRDIFSTMPHAPAVIMRPRPSLAISSTSDTIRNMNKLSRRYGTPMLPGENSMLIGTAANGYKHQYATGAKHSRTMTRAELSTGFIPVGVCGTANDLSAGGTSQAKFPVIVRGVVPLLNTSPAMIRAGERIVICAPDPEEPIIGPIKNLAKNYTKDKILWWTMPHNPNWAGIEQSNFVRSVLLNPPAGHGRLAPPTLSPYVNFDEWKNTFYDSYVWIHVLQQSTLTDIALGAYLGAQNGITAATPLNDIIAKLNITGVDLTKNFTATTALKGASTVPVDVNFRNAALEAAFGGAQGAFLAMAQNPKFEEWRKDKLATSIAAFNFAKQQWDAMTIAYAVHDIAPGQWGDVVVGPDH